MTTSAAQHPPWWSRTGTLGSRLSLLGCRRKRLGWQMSGEDGTLSEGTWLRQSCHWTAWRRGRIVWMGCPFVLMYSKHAAGTVSLPSVQSFITLNAGNRLLPMRLFHWARYFKFNWKVMCVSRQSVRERCSSRIGGIVYGSVTFFCCWFVCESFAVASIFASVLQCCIWHHSERSPHLMWRETRSIV